MSNLSSSMVILMRTTSYLMCKLKMGTLPFVMVALMRTTGLVWISCILRRDHKHSPVCCLCSRQYDMRDDTSINIIININLNTNITINEQMKNNVIKLTHIQQGRSQKTELQHQIHIQRNFPNMWISFRSLPVFPARVGKRSPMPSILLGFARIDRSTSTRTWRYDRRTIRTRGSLLRPLR